MSFPQWTDVRRVRGNDIRALQFLLRARPQAGCWALPLFFPSIVYLSTDSPELEINPAATACMSMFTQRTDSPTSGPTASDCTARGPHPAIGLEGPGGTYSLLHAKQALQRHCAQNWLTPWSGTHGGLSSSSAQRTPTHCECVCRCSAHAWPRTETGRHALHSTPHLGEFVTVLGFQVALHIRHELVQAQREVRLPVRRLRRHYPIPERCVDLRELQ
jgi:hypothetical protein